MLKGWWPGMGDTLPGDGDGHCPLDPHTSLSVCENVGRKEKRHEPRPASVSQMTLASIQLHPWSFALLHVVPHTLSIHHLG